MTVYKSVKNVGLDLQTPVFSHSQLYVALFRCHIKVLFSEGQASISTVNIASHEVLTGIL